MPRQSLGMVETRGFLAAVEAADAMCKTASVELVRYEVVRDGRVTIMVRGGVSEVESAVLAGGRAASRVGELLGTHIIPALESEVFDTLQDAAGTGPRRMTGTRGRSA
ncbi:MAG: BMC domain-containing protein [Candidatus Eisenbacteria bacterium]